MALVLANRVQESATANTTVSFTLTGAVAGFQTFAVVGDTNTTYYSATDSSGNWEVGLGTYSTTGPTLTRTTIYASSNGGSAVTFSGAVNVFVTYPSGKSVNLDGSGNVSALGTVASGTWQGSTVGVAYGGTGVTASSGANSVVIRDANQNITVNRVSQANTSTTAAGGTTALTAASSYIHTLVGTGSETYTMPDATTLTTGVAFVFNNMATGTLTIQNYAAGAVGTIPTGGAGAVFLTDNSTVGGIWDIHAYLPEGVTFGTNAFNLGSSIVSGGTWQGGTIQSGYGGTGLTTFTGANNALYSTGATTLTAGTLPVAAGGTGLSSTPTDGQLDIGNGTGFTRAALTAGTAISITNGSGSITVANTGVTSAVAGTGVSVSGATGAVTITNSGVTSAVAGTGISVSGATGAVTITNGGVTSITGTANQITASASTGSVTLSTPQSINTSASVQFGSFGVGTAASGTTGEIRATNNVTAYYSDDRLKTRLGKIENALDKLCSLEGFYYEANETAQALGYEVKREVGVSAQQVNAVMPEIVAPAPIDPKYMTVRYERALPLLIEAIKELREEVRALKG
jgi:hypothetical protein